jgi:hypothetical protein
VHPVERLTERPQIEWKKRSSFLALPEWSRHASFGKYWLPIQWRDYSVFNSQTTACSMHSRRAAEFFVNRSRTLKPLNLKAARKLRIDQIPVILCDEWSPAQVKAFRPIVNRSVSWASWDDELLALELQELSEADFDLSLAGFDPGKIDELLIDPEDDEPANAAPPLSLPPMMNFGEAESQTVEFSPALPYQGAFFLRTYHSVLSRGRAASAGAASLTNPPVVARGTTECMGHLRT